MTVRSGKVSTSKPGAISLPKTRREGNPNPQTLNPAKRQQSMRFASTPEELKAKRVPSSWLG